MFDELFSVIREPIKVLYEPIKVLKEEAEDIFDELVYDDEDED